MTSWDLTIPDLPRRSQYAFPRPIGLGTDSLESFTGIVGRTAGLYHVTSGTLCSQIFFRHLRTPYLRAIIGAGGTGFYKTSWTLNGTSGNAHSFSHLFNSLTGHSNLEYLTLLPWRSVLSNVRLLRKQRAWCPDCYREALESGSPVYEPLIWAIDAVKACGQHKKALATQCPNCHAKSQPVLDRKTWPGYCSVCGKWLGQPHDHYGLEQKDLAAQLWATTCVGSLIAAMPTLGMVPARSNVASGIKEIIKRYCTDNIAHFGRDIGIPRNTAWMWQQGSALPDLEALIAISARYSLDIVKFLSAGQIVEIHREQNQPNGYSLVRNGRKSRRPLDLNVVRARLQKIASASKEKPVSMEQVATQLGCSKRFLYQHFSGLCKQISQAHRNDLSHKHDVRIKRSRREVRQIISRMSADGLKPTYSLMRDKLKKPGMLREKAIRSEWFRARIRSPGDST